MGFPAYRLRITGIPEEGVFSRPILASSIARPSGPLHRWLRYIATGVTRRMLEKGIKIIRLGSGLGQGCTQQPRRDILLEKERETTILIEISRRAPFPNLSVGSLGHRVVNLEAG